MNFGKKILGAFISIDNETPPEQASQVKEEVQKVVVTSQVSYPLDQPPAPKSTTNYDLIVTETLEKANTAELNFYKFTKALSKVSPNLTDKERYTQAFVGWEVSDKDVNYLLSTYDTFDNALKDLGKQFHLSITSEKIELEKKRETAEALKLENEQWLKKIEENKQQISLLEKESIEGEIILVSESQAFDNACLSTINRFTEIKEKINQHLTNNGTIN